jgi:bifunctional non-homologous end joining protein LigD
VIDGEVVALDDSGRPSFNTLQNFGSSTVPIFYYAFDLLILGGLDMRFEALERRRELLTAKVLSKLREPIRYSPDYAIPPIWMPRSQTSFDLFVNRV